MKSFVRIAAAASCLLLLACEPTADPPTTDENRNGPINFTIRRQILVDEIRESGIVRSSRVLDAIGRVDRHRFVRPSEVDQAYLNRPLPIGEGQTISQPLVIAMMSEALAINPGDRVLEIGTGSGYQAAVLAEMGAKVYSVEIIPALAAWAEQNLHSSGYDEVMLLTRDGYFGWEEHAPFDAIIVTAAPDHVPQPLIRQLQPNGRLVVPIGPPGFYQTLWKIVRSADGVVASNLGPVRFVPFTGASVVGGD